MDRYKILFVGLITIGSIILGCEDGEKEPDEIIPADTTPVNQDPFPSLGHDAPYYPQRLMVDD